MEFVGDQRVQGHLGGYTPGGDPATFYPALWTWLVAACGVRSVLDVGCGDGTALDYFAGLGCRVAGIEGIEQNRPEILTHDYTTGYVLPVGPRFDLVWSCEFVEHVEAKHEENFLLTFEHGDLLLMTHAEPGQGGYHHVNCQPAEYWIERVEAHGFKLEERLTELSRRHAAENTNPWNHYVRSGLAFKREAPMHERMEQGEGHGREEQEERQETHTVEETRTETETTETAKPAEEGEREE